MTSPPLGSAMVFHIGPVPITQPVLTTWIIMIVLAVGSRWLTRRLRLHPTHTQTALETLITALRHEMDDVMHRNCLEFFPLLATLFIFLSIANLVGIIPGAQAPTARLETPAALAVIVFFSVHYFGVRNRGLVGYLVGFARPKLIMLPLNIISQITRTFSLMIRLFGNIMSGEFLLALAVTLAGLIVPIPLMALEFLVALVQAYIFTVLATVFIAAAVSGE